MPLGADASANFLAFEVTVELAGHRFTVPALPAADWLVILTAEHPDGTQILPGLLSEADQDSFDDLLMAGELDLTELGEAIRDTITVASGHPWWWSMGLLSAISGEGGTQALGEMSRLNAQEVSLCNWLNGLYSLLVRHMKNEDKAQLDTQLDTPPAGVEVDLEDLIDEQASTSAFFGMMRNPNG